MQDFKLADVLQQEAEQLQERRRKLCLEAPDQTNWFGIALSGGGIRSATLNLGFLKTLNRFGILQQADYLSTVSGGGYTHSYVQGTLKNEESYEKLFSEEHIQALRQHGEYMIPGQGIWKSFNTFLLVVAFLVSWVMSLVGLGIVSGIVYCIYLGVVGLAKVNPIPHLPPLLDSWWGPEWPAQLGIAVLSLLAVHFLVNIFLNFNLGISKLFNRIELVLVLVATFFFAWFLLGQIRLDDSVQTDDVPWYILYAGVLTLAGYLTNPNALSFHRYYRKQLADLFLRFAGRYQNIPLGSVFNAKSDATRDYLAPYPLINTCLNLQAPEGDAKFKGSKSSDYFLLSPLFCGSKLTSYVPTNAYWDYRSMTLPAAVTVSAAAVNPGLGMYSNRLLSALMTIFNARLGFWISNPLVRKKSYGIVWWPTYFFKELLGRIGTNNTMVNISDGGHIENLGVYELLRRGCRLIVAFDAGEDKAYTFFDLNNLLIRARNELGLEIRFRDDQQPEDLIRPRPSQVYSRRRFAVADIYRHWCDVKTVLPDGKEESKITHLIPPEKVGTFVYVKSSVTAPVGKPDLDEKKDPLRYGTYKYKIYHPDFPHEPTSDQFFDEIQWEAYYQVGQFIGADVLGLARPDEVSGQVLPSQLVAWFDHGLSLFPSVESTAEATAGSDFEVYRSSETPAAEAEPVTTPPTTGAESAEHQEVQYRM